MQECIKHSNYHTNSQPILKQRTRWENALNY